jgi:hypothetical protein
VPEKTEIAGGAFLIEKDKGAKGVETGWVHFFARPLPLSAKSIASLYDMDDEAFGVCC